MGPISMHNRACSRFMGIRLRDAALVLVLVLGGCAHNSAPPEVPADSELNAVPTDYKREILGAMHAYLNDPTGIRDASIGQPAPKNVNGLVRYVVCVRFNAKKRGNEYAGEKELAAVFMGGRFDHFLDKAQEHCAGTTYAPFPELQKLSR
jgi:hypothetical protein